MAGRRLTYLLTLGVCVVFYWAYREWFSWLLLLAVLWFPWMSLAVSLPAMVKLRMAPMAPRKVPQGCAESINLAGYCALPQPPVRGKLRITRLNTGETWTVRPGGALPTDHCGGLRITPVKTKIYDYLGLYRVRVRKNESVTTLVMPSPVKMQTPPDLDRFLARRWRPKFGGGYSENHELRLYRPGDSLNQVHWKLSAKTGKLILREPMEPERGLMLLTMDLRGTPAELDEKYGRLLWLGHYLLEKDLRYEIRALTGEGVRSWAVAGEQDLEQAVEALLQATPAAEGSARDRDYAASWQFHIGGDGHEG